MVMKGGIKMCLRRERKKVIFRFKWEIVYSGLNLSLGSVRPAVFVQSA